MTSHAHDSCLHYPHSLPSLASSIYSRTTTTFSSDLQDRIFQNMNRKKFSKFRNGSSSSSLQRLLFLLFFLSVSSFLWFIVIQTISFYRNHFDTTSPPQSSTSISSHPSSSFFFLVHARPIPSLTFGRSDFSEEPFFKDMMNQQDSLNLYHSPFLSIMNIHSTSSNDSRGTSGSSESYNPFYSISKQIASLKMNLVRMTFHGTQAPDTFDPESSDYWQGIGTLALGGGILSIISILMLLCCDTFRTLGCFGGVEPTKQLFYGREPRKEPYGMCQVFTLKIIIAVALVVVTGLVVLVIIGNVIFNNAFEYGRSNFKSGLNTMFNQSIELQIVTNRIQVASGSNAQLTDISSLMSQQQASMNATSTLTREIRHMNFIRYFLLMLIALVILFVPLLGLLSGVTHWKEFAAYGVRFGYMMLVCCWILYTVHFAFAVVTQDMCATADRYLQGQYSNSTGSSELVKQISSLVQIFSKCSNESVLVANSGIDMTLIDTMITSLNQKLTNDDPQKRYFNIIYANLSSAVTIDYVQANPQTQANVQKSVDTITLFHDDLVPTFMTHNNCSRVGQSFVNVVDSGCVGMLSSMNILWASYLVLGVLLFPIIWMNCLGYKRFRKKRFVLPKERKPEDIDIALNLH